MKIIRQNSKNPTVNYKDVMKLGFPEHTSRDIIRQAKKIAVIRFEEARNNNQNVLKLRHSPFDNRKIGIAPTDIVEELLGLSLTEEEREITE